VTGEDPKWLRRVSQWTPDQRPRFGEGLGIGSEGDGFPWFELCCGVEDAASVFEQLSARCAGLTIEMLEDLLTPDDEPEGVRYGDGSIRLASTFSVEPVRTDRKVERGTPQGAGVVRFQPVELLAGDDWLVSCWHPQRTFRGPNKIEEESASSADEVFRGVEERWCRGRCGGPGELGLSVMYELALGYLPTARQLGMWLEDWELSLYLDDEIDNRDELPELWGLMAVLRAWLNPLNRPGLREDVSKAWLPSTNLDAVRAVDDRVDRALAELGQLSQTLRQSFGLLHLEQAELQRRHADRMQRRIEIAAATFLVPTLVVGFYGANTWVPGQGRHWGFWVMVLALVLLSAAAFGLVTLSQRRTQRASHKASEERRRMRSELLGNQRPVEIGSAEAA
jgi:CorA-like Mg2+ transporter protein